MKSARIELGREALSENDDSSDVSSQVASNISLQETFPLAYGNSIATPSTTSAPLSLDLTLSFNSINDEPPGGGSSTSESTNEPASRTTAAAASQRVFSCNYCQRKFFSSQALGGHQNAHKRERTLAKRAMRMSLFSDRHASLSSLPLHGSSSSSQFTSLGIKAHSSLHHHGFAPPCFKPVDVRGNSRFVNNAGMHMGMPIFVEDDEAELLWPGSFRQATELGGFVLPQSWSPPVDESAPDLTLRL